MKKFKKSENCHRCIINEIRNTMTCTKCNLCLCTPCYYHFIDYSQKYQIKVNYLPCGFIEVVCYNCQEYQRVMNKIDCWLAVHGSDE